jgi:hypothetical protein
MKQAATKATHVALGVALAKVDNGWAIEVAAKGPERLVIALSDAQLRVLVHLIAAALPPPSDQSEGH